jgi:hypothetical protein
MIRSLITAVLFVAAGVTNAVGGGAIQEDQHWGWPDPKGVPISITTVPTPLTSTEIKPPMSFGDERREPRPITTSTLPPHRESAPDWRCDEWMPLAREIGWPEEELPRLSYTIYRESRCRPDQHNPDDPMGGSNGLVQINQFWCKSTQYWPEGWLQAHGALDHCDELFDPEVNLKSALLIWGNSGWSPWFP